MTEGLPHMTNVALAICTPVPYVQGPEGPRLAMVSTQWHRARMQLATPTNFNYVQVLVDGLEVGDARNRAVRILLDHDPLPEFILFLDYDTVPPFDAACKLVYRARCFPSHHIFAGVYCAKGSPPEPLIYCGDGKGSYWDWTVGDLLTEGVTGVGMGCTLIRTSLLQRMAQVEPEGPWFRTTQAETTVGDNGAVHTRRGTEDLWFCKVAVEEYEAQILVDTSVLCGHVDHRTGKIFGLPPDSLPVKRAHWLTQGRLGVDKAKAGQDQGEAADGPQRLALDLGAGPRRRSWPGHKTYTTDLRPDVGADYVMDTRLLNLHDETYDLVASSHHLEHLGRWDQERVWAEMFRVTKPGGVAEHIVPNLEWAAAKIVGGECDGHVYNVLYGAQESHGYERGLNTHYFGYTPDIAVALAEGAGFVDVSTEGYRDNPDLTYDLVIRARRPGGVVEVVDEEAHSEEVAV